VQSPDHADCDLAAVRDQDASEHQQGTTGRAGGR
jgi:hypothetical protein